MSKLLPLLIVLGCNAGRMTKPTDLHHSVQRPPVMHVHFYVKQGLTIEDTAFTEAEWLPCVCIHCKDLNICK
jgi:hypothetical protein